MTAKTGTPAGRIASVDIFRALTMLIMLFVNDFAGMSNIPHWMHHAAMDEDMLGFSDLVFPAFLFCVGMSIPFAIRTRYRKGDSHLQVIGHIVVRTLALLIMGIFSMNMKSVEGGMSHSAIALTAIAAYFLLWNVYPKKNGKDPVWVSILKALGIVILAGLVIYKDLNGMPFKVGWWGILGLIGWAYVTCALAYVFTQGKFNKVTAFWILSIILCILNCTKAIPRDFSSRAIILGFLPGGWTHVALCASGMMASSMLIHFVAEKQDMDEETRRKSVNNMLIYLWILGFAMFLLGMVSHRFWIISKIMATPTWLFFCTAICFPLFALIYWIADIKGKTKWARPIAPAGTSTLTCYIIPSIWYSVQSILGLHWPAALTNGGLGLVKALAFSFAIIGLTWVFGKCHLKLKI